MPAIASEGRQCLRVTPSRRCDTARAPTSARPLGPRAPGATQDADAVLVARAKKGDDTAFATLYQRHRGEAARWALALVDRSEAEDVAAEAFTRVFEHLRKGRGPSQSFAAYLRTAVRNIAIDHYRAAARRVMLTADVERTLLDAGHAVGRMEPRIETIADDVIVRQAFAALPQRWQEALWFVLVRGQTPSSAAGPLQLTPNAVASLTKRAKEGLRSAYLAAHVNPCAPAQCRSFLADVATSLRSPGGVDLHAIGSGHARQCLPCRQRAADLGTLNATLP